VKLCADTFLIGQPIRNLSPSGRLAFSYHGDHCVSRAVRPRYAPRHRSGIKSPLMSDLMSDPRKQPEAPPEKITEDDAIFSAPPEEPSHRGLTLGIVGFAVIAILAGIFLPRGEDKTPARTTNTILQADAHAKSLVFSQLAMSQSTSLSGQTSTFLDGHIKNNGTSTLTAATLQVIFRNDVGLSPQVESLPLTLIRTRQPYIDTEPVSAAPIKSGGEVEFRLIFESIPENWNQQMPEIDVVHTTLQ
jgi:Protein of unknown function (DUF2393)